MVGVTGLGARPVPAPDTVRDRLAVLPWRTILAAWVAARLVVAAAYAAASLAVHHGFVSAGPGGRPRHLIGLLGFDAGWYAGIASHGYAGMGRESLRFFPLLPLAVRGLAAPPGLRGHSGGVLIVLVNLVALAFVAAVAALARAEFTRRADAAAVAGGAGGGGAGRAGAGVDGPADVAGLVRRTVVFASLAPPAFVLVMGYAEALFGLFAVVCLAAARTRRWEWAAFAGALAALCRPVGVLLVAPLLVEAARDAGWLRRPRDRRPRDRRPGARRAAAAGSRGDPAAWALRALAVAGPLIGAGCYLAWVRRTYGDALLPLRVQRQADLHGASSNPVQVLADAASGVLHGHVGTALHVPWLVAFALLTVVMARRLPASYTVWAALTFVTILTGSNLDSSERYLYAVFPFLFVAADLTRRREVYAVAATASTVAMFGYATLVFVNAYVP